MAVTAYGRPLELLDLPLPEVPPTGHALLEVLACGVCFSDVKVADGKMAFSPTLDLPHVPGHEICARVLAADPASGVEPGRLVVVHHYASCGVCDACRAGDESLCRAMRAWIGFTSQGGFAERVVVPLDRLFEVPDGIDPVLAAPLTCAIGTAYRSVVGRGQVRAGDRVAVIGLGGVGLHTVQVARACGARTVGVDTSAAARAAAGRLGIDAVDDDLGAVAEELGGAADVVVDNVGTDATFSLGAGALRAGGRLVAVGYSPTTRLQVATPRLVLDELEFVGSRYVRGDELGRALALVAAGEVEPVVGRVRPLADVNEVFDELRAGAGVGRTVLRVAG